MPSMKRPYFQSQRLTAEQKADFIQLGQDSFQKLMSLLALVGVDGKSTVPFNQGTNYTTASHTNMRATVNQVAELYQDLASKDAEEYNQCMDILDNELLCMLMEPSMNSEKIEFMNIRWIANESGVPLAKSRDLCMLEYGKQFVDERGRECYGRLIHSLDDYSQCSLTHSKRLGHSRASLQYSGYIFYESGVPGVLYGKMIIDRHFDNKMPSWMSEILPVRTIVHDFLHIQEMVISKFRTYRSQYTSNTYHEPQASTSSASTKSSTSSMSSIDMPIIHEPQVLPPPTSPAQQQEQSAPSEDKKFCMLCGKGFGTFRRRYDCLTCAHNVCRSCSRSVDSKAITTSKTIVTSTRLCVLCYCRSNTSTSQTSSSTSNTSKFRGDSQSDPMYSTGSSFLADEGSSVESNDSRVVNKSRRGVSQSTDVCDLSYLNTLDLHNFDLAMSISSKPT